MPAPLPPSAASLADRLARLTPEQRERLRERLGQGSGPAAATGVPRRSAGRDAAPLSSAQRRFWFLQSLDMGGHSYNSGAALRITGALDEPGLLRALNQVVARQEALRSVIEPDPSTPDAVRQRVLPLQPPTVARFDLSATDAATRDAALLDLLCAQRELPFDPAQGLARYALIRTAAHEVVLFFCLHHIIADGWSFGVFMRDLQAAYAGEALADLPVQFGDYAAWEAERAASPSHRDDIHWWVDRLASAPATLDLPAPARAATGTSMLALALPGDVDMRLRAFAAQVPGATPFVVLLAVLKAVLYRATLQPQAAATGDLVVATALAHRDQPELAPLIGNFADVVLLRTAVADDPAFTTLVGRVRDALLDAQAHGSVSLAEVIDALEVHAVRQGAPASIGPRRPPAEVLLSFLNVPHPAWDAGGLRYSMVEIPGDQQDFGLYLSFHDNEGGLQGQMSWRRDRFDDATAHVLARAFEALLPALLAQPALRLSAPALPCLDGLPHHASHRTSGRDTTAMAAALRAVPGVLDAVVQLRDAGQASVAYLVVDGPVGDERLQAMLDAVPPALRPDAACPVTRLPLTSHGAVDGATLERLPVLDAPLLQALERDHPERGALIVEATDALPRHRLPPVAAVSSSTPRADAPPVNGPPALADGGALQLPAHAPRTLVDALVATAQAHTGHPIHYAGHSLQDAPRIQTYAELLHAARVRLAGLRQHGLQPGSRAILSFGDLREHITSFWACLLGGIVPVTVAVAPSYRQHNGVVGKLVNTWQHLGRPAVLSTSELAPALRGLAEWLPEARLDVIAVDTLPAGLPPAGIHNSAPADTAFIQLSSGSTGVPKCIAITHTGVIHHVHAAVAASGLSGDDVSLNWLPLDHVVPMLTCHLKDVCLGRRQVLVPTDAVLAEPLYWLDLIEHYRVTHSWAPNFAFRLVSARLAAQPQRRWDLSSMRWFVDAGEQTTAAVVTEFLERTRGFGLPPAAVHNEFGMAELCTTMTFGAGFDPARSAHRFRKDSLRGRLQLAVADAPDAEVVSFVSAGKPVPGVRLRIADAQGSTVAEGVIGRLQVQGAVVTPGYIDNPEANAAAFADAGWFDTGDLGFIAAGELTLTGRAKETIIIRGANFYCYEIEDVVNTLPDVRPTYVACCAADDAAAGTDGLAVFYVPAQGAASHAVVRERITAVLGSVLGLRPNVIVPLEPDEFPKTTSGKIQRSWLAEQLKAGAYAQRLEAIEADAEHGGALPAWFSQPVWRPAQRRLAGTATDHALWIIGGTEAWVQALGNGWGGAVEHIANNNPATLTAELAATLDRCGWPGELLDLSACEGRPALGHLQHLFALGQWLAGAKPPSGLRLTVVTQNAAWGTGLGAGALDIEQAVIEPVVTTMALEESIQARCIDVSGATPVQVDALLHELRANDPEPIVALRDNQRRVRRLRPVEPGTHRDAQAFGAGMTVLITGGLGGVGFELATQLLTRYRARLLLVGRQPEAAVAPALARLRALPGSVVYAACDVADARALATAVADAEHHWDAPLQAALHLAGSFHHAAWHDESPDALHKMLAPKLAGTQAVLDVVATRPAAFALLFSSASAHLPGTGSSLYAAANRALEACAANWSQQHGPRCRVLAWSAWPGLGMSRDSVDPALLRASSGYLGITPTLGWQSLALVMGSSEPLTVIGLDPTHARVRRWLEHTPLRRQSLVVATEGRMPPAAVADRFGTAAAVRAVSLPALPRDASGTIDRAQLALAVAPSGTQAHRAPQTPAELALAQVWGELLGTRRIGAADHFFALGGHSLLAVQLVARIRDQLGVSLTPRAVFESPTLEGLAGIIEAESASAEFEEGVL